MRKIVVSSQYKSDLKLARKRSLPEKELDTVIRMLMEDTPLPAKHKDHALVNNYKNCRECHIRPDWLLLYMKEDDEEVKILRLVRTGTHSDLF